MGKPIGIEIATAMGWDGWDGVLGDGRLHTVWRTDAHARSHM